MTNEQLVAIFNPNNAANLTAEQIEQLRNLTDAEIDVLAEQYPNQPQRRAYLKLFDKNVKPEKQLFALSTWQNLRNLRKFSSKKNLIPWEFVQTAIKVQAAKQIGIKASKEPVRKVVVDMSAQEAADELRKSMKATPIAAVKITIKDKKIDNKKEEIKSKVAAKKEVVKPAVNEPADQEFPAITE